MVSQFTLYARTDKGRRPSWNLAAPGDQAEPLVREVVDELRRRGATVETGVFGATMQVASVNDGPFTVIVELSGSLRRASTADESPDRSYVASTSAPDGCTPAGGVSHAPCAGFLMQFPWSAHPASQPGGFLYSYSTEPVGRRSLQWLILLSSGN